MYINWFTWIIIFHSRICYTQQLGVMIIIQLYQRNGKFPLPPLKQGSYPQIPLYGGKKYGSLFTIIPHTTLSL